ncbi:MAG: TonB-dependent receptor, partial [Tardiphaga sp.]
NGKASILYKPSANSSVYAMAASSKLPPGSSFTVSGNHNSAQNPIYDPQETVTTEIGGKLDLLRQKLALTAALFRTEVKNEVEQDPVDLKYYQTGKKRVQGVELGATGELARNWLVSAGYLYMDTRVAEGKLVTAGGENHLTYTPKSSFTLWTSYDLPFGLKVGGGARYSDRLLRGTDGAIGTPAYTDAYWVFDAMASWQVNRNLDLRLNVYNLGDGLTSVMGAVVLEIFQGKQYGSIFGTIMLAALAGGAAGPWATGLLHDLSGSYTIAFAIGIAVSLLSAVAIWQASPRKVRAVAGQMHKGHGAREQS